ncbi:extracellular solute-binding protein [Paenibacillus psychroresistens]|uniref:Extracellular solute-binding protein n=1 Tax=Paenibacillus psychroresistens TaxID=1778678 RepID=A0A6B8RTM3_9BACL|nr:extracellular solute-binding protein [Paenibacillus psychroresistens]QGQ98915.1 extracellular solute-binding protein [Paenibacillus psychroresistens]
MKYICQVLLIISLTFLISSCEGIGQSPKTVKKEIVELKFWGEGSREYFDKEIAEPIKAQFPNIKLTLLMKHNLKLAIDENVVPDIMLEPVYGQQSESVQLGLQLDLTNYIKVNALDTSHFEPGVLEDEPISSLPFTRTHYVLSYNKALFDSLGIDYPTDGMTWDETLKLAAKLKTAGKGKSSLYGLYLTQSDIPIIASQLSLTFVDPVTNEPTLMDKRWDQLFQLWKSADTAPYYRDNENSHVYYETLVSPTKEIAMSIVPAYWNANGITTSLVSLPVFTDNPRGGADAASTTLSISKQSKHKDQAFQVIQYLVSDEFQMQIANKGQFSSLNKTIIADSFGSKVPGITKEMINSLNYNDLAVRVKRSKFDHFQDYLIKAGAISHVIDTSIPYWEAFDHLKKGEDKQKVLRGLTISLKYSVDSIKDTAEEYRKKLD